MAIALAYQSGHLLRTVKMVNGPVSQRCDAIQAPTRRAVSGVAPTAVAMRDTRG